jgi:hypothetical protein
MKKKHILHHAAIQQIEKINNTFFGESERRKKEPLPAQG